MKRWPFFQPVISMIPTFGSSYSAYCTLHKRLINKINTVFLIKVTHC